MMQEFLFWFMRPLGEFLGVIALFVGVFSISLIFMLMCMIWLHFKEKSKKLKELFNRSL